MEVTRRDWKLNLKTHILSIDKSHNYGSCYWRIWIIRERQDPLAKMAKMSAKNTGIFCVPPASYVLQQGWRFFHLLLGGQYKQTCSSAQTVGSSSQSSGRCWRLRYECWEWRWTACTWPGLASACWTGSVDVRRSRKNDTSTHNGGSGLYEAYLPYYFFVSRKDKKIDHKTVGLAVSKLGVK